MEGYCRIEDGNEEGVLNQSCNSASAICITIRASAGRLSLRPYASIAAAIECCVGTGVDLTPSSSIDVEI